jgi:hypothetical protein
MYISVQLALDMIDIVVVAFIAFEIAVDSVHSYLRLVVIWPLCSSIAVAGMLRRCPGPGQNFLERTSLHGCIGSNVTHSLYPCASVFTSIFLCCLPRIGNPTSTLQMVLAPVADFFTNGDSTHKLVDSRSGHVANTAQAMEIPVEDTRRRTAEAEDIDEDAARPPYLHVRMPSLQK